MSQGALAEAAGATPGALPWTFAAPDSAFDYLGAGQSATLTYAFQISDGHGGSLNQNVAVTITGTNDAPLVTVPGAQTARTSGATRISGITVADADANASETVTLTTSVGTLAATATGGATVAGSASKTLTVSGSITQVNAALASVTYTASATAGSDTIAVSSSDGSATNSKSIAVTTSTTANHNPTTNAATTASGSITELVGMKGSATADTASGSIKFDDADVPDTHTITINSVSASGITSGLPANATLLSYLSKGTVVEPTGTSPGAVTWTFSAPDSTFDYLQTGQVATLSYVVTVTDSKGGAVTQNVVISVTGTNDAALLAAGSTTSAALTELANVTGSSAADTASGAIKFTDDAGDTHTATITGVAVSGTVSGLPASATMLAWLSKGALVEQAGSTPGSLGWSFSAPDSAFDYLGTSQTATLTYTVQIADNSGAIMTQNVVVTVTGSNDQPVATTKSGFTTDTWTALTITGATLYAGTTDPDTGDTFSLSSVQAAVGGSVALTSGNAVFTPSGGSVGPASFTYTVSDGHSGTSTATANLTITLHQITGTSGANTLSGNATKKSQIDGQAGNDTITAGGVGDTLIGGAGNDTITGGAGIDTFVFHSGFGADIINSFTASGTSHDIIQIDKTLFADWAHLLGATTQVGTDLKITYDASNTITLKNVALANFTSADAVFV
jgi:VCBS repeat-containing protein